ncbi:hypothetical protein CDS [Bradyrhizobium sp.]|nr:hypothetical protein CDS [Bradyrhizobium sp.]
MKEVTRAVRDGCAGCYVASRLREGRLPGVGRAGRHCEAALLATAPARSLPPCGGGRGRGVAPGKVYPSAIVPCTTNRGSPHAVPLEGMMERCPPHWVARMGLGDPQIQNDPEGGIPSGSLEVLGGLTKPYVSFIGGKFFRLMLCFVSIIASAVTLPCQGTGPKPRSYPIEILGLRQRNGRRRRP